MSRRHGRAWNVPLPAAGVGWRRGLPNLGIFPSDDVILGWRVIDGHGMGQNHCTKMDVYIESMGARPPKLALAASWARIYLGMKVFECETHDQMPSGVPGKTGFLFLSLWRLHLGGQH